MTVKNLYFDNPALLGTLRELIHQRSAPSILRKGREGVFYTLLGAELSSLAEAKRLDSILERFRSNRRTSTGWSRVLRLPQLEKRIPLYHDGYFLCGEGRVDHDYYGTCRLSSNPSHCFTTEIKDGVRYWQVASVHAISTEYRRC